MKFRGGYNIPLSGRPDDKLVELSAPDTLRLPLSCGRFSFTDIVVKDGDKVSPGQILARDEANHNLPLLAPLGGKVTADSDRGCIEISVDSKNDKSDSKDKSGDKKQGKKSGSLKISTLVELGAWNGFYFLDNSSNMVPSPEQKPDVILVSPFRPGFFQPSAKAVLSNRLDMFTAGINALSQLFKDVRIVVVLPDSTTSTFAVEVDTSVKDSKGVEVIKVPERYPYGELLTTSMVLNLDEKGAKTVFGLYASGVVAVGMATEGEPCLTRVISLAGPVVKEPVHYSVPLGYPVSLLVKDKLNDCGTRLIKGGALSGTTVTDHEMGIDIETEAITAVEEHTKREFLSFMRPGFDRSSYIPAFIGNFIKPNGGKGEPLTTAARGEVRPCVSCGYCEEVCPLGLMPYYIHRLLYQDELEQAEKAHIDRCTSCGICTYVCPSKIELSQQFIDGRQLIATELHGEEEEA